MKDCQNFVIHISNLELTRVQIIYRNEMSITSDIFTPNHYLFDMIQALFVEQLSNRLEIKFCLLVFIYIIARVIYTHMSAKFQMMNAYLLLFISCKAQLSFAN